MTGLAEGRDAEAAEAAEAADGAQGAAGAGGYDPFGAGPFAVSQTTIEAPDRARNRVFPCEIWSPVAGTSGSQEAFPLVVFCHGSGGHRMSAAYLCAHLAGHGYLVAAIDHSEVIAAELGPREGETAGQRADRVDAIIASRVPDVRFLLGYLLGGGAGPRPDPDRVGLAGHSFGGWTVLAVPEADDRVRSVAAFGPGGSARPLPGILPLRLSFAWHRTVPVLYLAAAQDVPIPLDAVRELAGRTPGPARMFVLDLADHQHFLDDVAGEHEGLRGLELTGDAAWIPGAMAPVSELCPPEHAHLFVRGLTLAHFDATLCGSAAAGRFLAEGAVAALAARGVAASAEPGYA